MDTSSGDRHGASSRQAAITRYGAHEVRRRQESGEWQSPWPGVLVERVRAADPLTLASAAVLLGGAEAFVGGPTAAYLHGCRSMSPTPVHLVVPYSRGLRSRPGLVVHNGPLPDADRDVVAGLPVLGLERVLTDVLCTSRPSDALAVADEVLATFEPAQRDAFRAVIGRRLERRRDPRGTRRGARLLAVATGLAASPAESWLLWRVVDSGFPVPEVNWRLIGLDGIEIYRLDLAWPELRILVEYDGYAAHVGRESEDAARAEDLRRRGWIIIRAVADDLASPGRLEAELERAFGQRGIAAGKRTPGVLRGRRHREPREVRRARRVAG